MNLLFDDLFKKWKKRQEEETDASCAKTFPKKDGQSPQEEKFKTSFSPDGFLSDNFNRVLFILKESNTCRDEPKGEYEDTFWFKENADKEQKGQDVDSYWNKYHINMKWYLKEIFADTKNYYECAYMNLNKRGGYGECDFAQLSNYVTYYQDLIKQQIKIIKPTHIFCCGSNEVRKLVEPIINDIVNDSKESINITLYDCYHLSLQNRRNIKETIVISK